MSRSRDGISLVESEDVGIGESPNKPGSDAAEQSEHAWHVANFLSFAIALSRAKLPAIASPSTLPYRAPMNLSERITVNPRQCGGRPCIRGMRIRVKDVL